MDDKVYNAAAVIDNTNMIGVYHKAELPNYGVFDENIRGSLKEGKLADIAVCSVNIVKNPVESHRTNNRCNSLQWSHWIAFGNRDRVPS